MTAAERMRKWRSDPENRAAERARAKTRKKSPEKTREYTAAYRLRNPEKIKATYQQQYARRKERFRTDPLFREEVRARTRAQYAKRKLDPKYVKRLRVQARRRYWRKKYAGVS